MEKKKIDKYYKSKNRKNEKFKQVNGIKLR